MQTISIVICSSSLVIWKSGFKMYLHTKSKVNLFVFNISIKEKR